MDTIADMLTQIRNATAVNHKHCLVRFSKIKEEIIKILKEEGRIEDYKVEEKNGYKNIKIFLGYKDNKPLISCIKRISKPGRRVYQPFEKLPYVLKGFGFLILSTNKGVMTDRSARKEKVGGEVMCEVW